MERNEILTLVLSKDQKATYEAFCRMVKIEESNKEIAAYYQDYLRLINHEKSYIRLKSFIMIVKSTKFLDYEMIETNNSKILAILDDEKPTIIRQAIPYFVELASNQPKLKSMIITKLKGIDLNSFKDSMSPLIKKDIENALAFLA